MCTAVVFCDLLYDLDSCVLERALFRVQAERRRSVNRSASLSDVVVVYPRD